ncbi:MAG: DNA polymerase III subunit gamma/tau [Smithellaceae bacterium]|nr:DNA polymerase III subunit gamma/tau [Smithellaceae bacterium]
MAENTQYQVLARKCRPQVFEDVLGQEHVTRTLKNAIINNRIPHALVLSGPRGVGKTSIARIMAKALNCENGPTPQPCNSCSNCLDIASGVALDVREIDGASNRGIDEIRELRENVNFSPAASPYKIYIIDEVHMLTREAFNALLKTLEEPPGHAIFIFATTETHKVPATILSRCQCFELRRISLRQLVTSLRAVARAEGIEISDRALAWLAEAADGSLRDAQGMFDQAISFAGTNIDDEKIEELLGLADRRFLFLLSDAVFARDAGRCLAVLEEGYYAGLDMKHFYGMLLGHFRNCLLVKILGPEAALVELSAEDLQLITAQVAPVSQDDLHRLLNVLMAEEEKVKRSYDAKVSLEVILLRMALLPPAVPILAIMERLESLEKRLAGQQGSIIAPPSAAIGAGEKAEHIGMTERTNDTINADPGETGDPWEGCKSFIKKSHPILYSKIAPGRFLDFEQGIMRIGFPRNYLFLDDVKAEDQLQALAEIARKYFPALEEVRVELLEPTPRENSAGGPNGSPAAQRINGLRREALNHPALLKIMDTFTGAEVREVIPRGNNS